jgi:hypothetical protein
LQERLTAPMQREELTCFSLKWHAWSVTADGSVPRCADRSGVANGRIGRLGVPPP